MDDLTKERLEYWYYDQKWSLTDIAKYCNMSIGSVHYKFRKYNIPTRDFRTGARMYHDALHNFPVDIEVEEFIEGNLLGDGYLRKFKTGSNPIYAHGDKHLEYIQWIVDYFKTKGIPSTIIKQREDYWVMQTMTNTNFNSLYERWYREDGDIKLKLPDDFKLTPVKLRQWYIGDGNSKKWGGLHISKDSRLSVDDKTRLQSMIDETLGIVTNWHRDGDNKMSKLYVKSSDLGRFFEYIGGCPSNCYEYKWKRATNSTKE